MESNMYCEEYKGLYICSYTSDMQHCRVKDNPNVGYALHHGSFDNIAEARSFIDKNEELMKRESNKKSEKPSFKELHMLDMRDVKVAQIEISEDGKTLWVNTELGCVLRMQNIGEININTQQATEVKTDKSVKTLFGGRIHE